MGGMATNEPSTLREALRRARGAGSQRAAAACTLWALMLVGACSEDAPGSGKGQGAGGGIFDDIGGVDDSGPLFDVGGEDVAPVDVEPEPGAFGAPCKGNGDCDSGLCIQAADGKVCTELCVETCQPGWNCAAKLANGTDQVFLCVPLFVSLCDPCNDNLQCNEEGKSGNVCISFGAAGSFCGVACDEVDPECPTGYSCQSVVDKKSGLTSHQCVRTTGLCTCSRRAVELALETTCTSNNLYGSCVGSRHCMATGLSQCGAPVPAEEACNGVDDDCNGKTDDFAAGVAKCNKSNQFGSCPGKVLACEDGKPVCDALEAKPEQCNGIDDNCDGKTDEGICDDDQDCTIDSCDSAGGCKHKGVTGTKCSDDGDPCTNDLCNEDGQCAHKPVAGMVCDDGSICTQTDKCVAGTCVGGNTLGCDDKDPCTSDACDPFTGCTHSPASDAVCTDDGLPCTLDQCQDGKCVHKANEGGACTDDGKPCTLDTCANGICTHPLSSGGCDDGNPCTENDVCSGGACQAGTNKSCNDGQQCTQDSCDPKQGCQHSTQAMDFKPCTAGAAECPVGFCNGGFCASKANEPCETKVKVDLCSSVKALGTCTSGGKCVAKTIPEGYTCPGCKSVCIKCGFLPICLDLFFSSLP